MELVSGAVGLMSLQLRQTFTVMTNRQSGPEELNHFTARAWSREALLTQGEHFHKLQGGMDPCKSFLLYLSSLHYLFSHYHLMELLWAHQG